MILIGLRAGWQRKSTFDATCPLTSQGIISWRIPRMRRREPRQVGCRSAGRVSMAPTHRGPRGEWRDAMKRSAMLLASGRLASTATSLSSATSRSRFRLRVQSPSCTKSGGLARNTVYSQANQNQGYARFRCFRVVEVVPDVIFNTAGPDGPDGLMTNDYVPPAVLQVGHPH